MTKNPTKSEIMSLHEFARLQRREGCPVCKLPDYIREQIITASDRGIKRRQVLEWLREKVGVAISDQELSVHRNGRHDDAEA
jgi:hypothetical protein